MQSQSMSSIFKNKTFSFSAVFISVSLILYPATVLSVAKVNGLIFSLFALSGLFLLFRCRNKSTQVNHDEMLFYFSLGIFFLVSLFITIYGGFIYKAIGKYLHLLLAIPVYIYLRYSGVKLCYIWYGLVAGSVVAAGVAVYESLILNISRVQSLTHPIIFGNLALVMGCMSMAGYGWFKQRKNWQLVFPVFALICGILASILSLSRGGWVAVPFLMIVFFWYIQSHFLFRHKIIVSISTLIFLGAIYAIPQTKVSFQIDRTITSLQQYEDSDINSYKRATSVGTRFEMWQASWKMFLDNPVMGVGWGHYLEQAQLQVDQGLRNRSAATFDHPHSEYFSVLAYGGILGFLALILMFLTLTWLFVKYIKQGETADIRRLALAGLVLVVAYMAFGLSEPMLLRSRSVNFFAFYLAVFMSAIYGQSREVS